MCRATAYHVYRRTLSDFFPDKSWLLLKFSCFCLIDSCCKMAAINLQLNKSSPLCMIMFFPSYCWQSSLCSEMLWIMYHVSHIQSIRIWTWCNESTFNKIICINNLFVDFCQEMSFFGFEDPDLDLSKDMHSCYDLILTVYKFTISLCMILSCFVFCNQYSACTLLCPE